MMKQGSGRSARSKKDREIESLLEYMSSLRCFCTNTKLDVYNRENRKSLRTGELENSGLSNTQLIRSY
jgi:hypothetical protein